MKYFYVKNGEKCGPAGVEELSVIGISTDTQVWREGMTDWAAAGTIEELRGICAPPTPVSPQTPPPTQAYGAPQGAPQAAPFCGEQKPVRPDNHMVWAILTTLLCCMPLGIVSIVKSNQVDSRYNAGEYAAAEQASRSAKSWATWGAISGVVFGILYAIIVAIVGIAGANL